MLDKEIYSNKGFSCSSQFKYPHITKETSDRPHIIHQLLANTFTAMLAKPVSRLSAICGPTIGRKNASNCFLLIPCPICMPSWIDKIYAALPIQVHRKTMLYWSEWLFFVYARFCTRMKFSRRVNLCQYHWFQYDIFWVESCKWLQSHKRESGWIHTSMKVALVSRKHPLMDLSLFRGWGGGGGGWCKWGRINDFYVGKRGTT